MAVPLKRVLSPALLLALLWATSGSVAMQAQTPSTPPAAPSSAVPRQSGTVKAVTPHDFVLTTAGGQDFAVTVPANARIIVVPPGSTNLSAGQPGAMSDIAAGDRTIVNGTTGDTGPLMNATRVILIKSNAIAARNAADQAAWAQGASGIVRTVDPGTGIIAVANGARSLTVDVSAKTVVRRYAGTSVRFEDAVGSSVTAIQPGDQLRARGQRTADGSALVADEIVTGSFANFSGVLTAVDVTMDTVSLKDLASKQTVTVVLTNGSNLRRLPPGAMAAMSTRAGGDSAGHPGAPPAEGARGDATRPTGAGGGRSGIDLSRMISRLPTETVAGLKAGDAVMIVAARNPQTNQPTAITLVAGVEQILAAHPAGETTLSPWSLGGGAGDAEAGGGEAAAH